jgi:hypothetical protein
MYTFRSSECDSSDLPGFDPSTLNRKIRYCHLMTKWSGLGDSTELSRMGLSQKGSASVTEKLQHNVSSFQSACSS